MWLIGHLKEFLGWAFSVGRRIVRLAAGPIALVILATVVSQLSQLLAFFLPFKIVSLTRSHNIPRYFPDAFANMGRESLVLWLGLAAIGFYLLHLLADRISDLYAERSADRVLGRSAKLVLFVNQDDIARNACRKFAESIAGLIFVGIGMALIAVIFPTVVVALIGSCVVLLVLVALAGIASVGLRTWLEGHAAAIVGAVRTVGVFAVTAAIVAEFIAGASFNVLNVVISLLLTRQILRRVSQVLKNALSLNSRKLFINALFMHGHIWAGKAMNRKSILDLLVANTLDRWLPAVLLQTTGRKAVDLEMTRWLQTGIVDVLAFEARAADGDGSSAEYFLKLFGRRKNVAAVHEAALLSSVFSSRFPAPPFLGSAEIGDDTCHVYEKISGQPLMAAELKEAQAEIQANCWECTLPHDLVKRYRRTHQLLDQRLSATPTDYLMLAAHGADERELVEEFDSALKPLTELLNGLPLVLNNPDLGADGIFRLDNGAAIAVHWGRWRLEPVGAGWPVAKTELKLLPHWLKRAKAHRPDLAAVTPDQAKLAALLFELDGVLARQRYRSAIELLPQILDKAHDAGIAGPRRSQAAAGLTAA